MKISDLLIPFATHGQPYKNQTKKPSEKGLFGLKMVVQARIELATHGFSVHCSTN